MIVKTLFSVRSDGVRLFRTYSDIGVCIQQHPTEDIYEEAIDVEDAPYTYTETDIPISNNEGGETI